MIVAAEEMSILFYPLSFGDMHPAMFAFNHMFGGRFFPELRPALPAMRKRSPEAAQPPDDDHRQNENQQITHCQNRASGKWRLREEESVYHAAFPDIVYRAFFRKGLFILKQKS